MLILADVFVPDFGMLGDEGFEEFAAFLVVEVDDVHAVFAQPVEAAGEGAAFSDDDCADAELADEPASNTSRGPGW